MEGTAAVTRLLVAGLLLAALGACQRENPGTAPAGSSVRGLRDTLLMTSRLSAYIIPFTFCAPSRLNMIG